MSTLIAPALVRLDADLGADKEAVIRSLAGIVGDADRSGSPDQLVADALAREATSNTGLPGGIAIPHCRTSAVSVPTLAFARLAPAVDFGAKDGPADLAFLIAAPEGGDASHLEILTKLARALVRKDFTEGLRKAETPDDVVALINTAVGGGNSGGAHAAPAATKAAPAAATAAGSAAGVAASTPVTGDTRVVDSQKTESTLSEQKISLVAVTACPTGIAHTYMAAEALEAAAARAGVTIAVETQGSAGSTPLSADTIANASAAIFACDVGVRDRARFAGKPVVSAGVKRAIDDADGMIADAIRYANDPGAPRVEGTAAAASSGGGANESWGGRVRRILMTGVSYMIPFVAAGGLLIALGFLFGGYDVAGVRDQIVANSSLFNLPDLNAIPTADGKTMQLTHALFNSPLFAYLGALMFVLGVAAFGFMVPALAGYIAYAIADRPGIAPGFVMGAIAGTVKSGFLGGIIGGVLAGLIAHWLSGRKVPTWARGLMPVLVIPLLTTLIAGFIMVVVLNKPLTSLMTSLTNGLNSLQGGSAVVLGMVLGLMMAFDMGGPLNKVAYGFATTGLATVAASAGNTPQFKIMAAVMLAGMVPPLALALATVVRPKLFSPAERENGKAAWALGISFITEGAIPFAAADPLRVIPSIMAGSAVTGALSMALDVGSRAPHGGIFVLFAIFNVIGFIIALVAGVLVAAALVIVLKGTSKTNVEELTPVA